MTRLNHLYGGVNLSQGFPDFAAPAVVKEAACAAIMAEVVERMPEMHVGAVPAERHTAGRGGQP